MAVISLSLSLSLNPSPSSLSLSHIHTCRSTHAHTRVQLHAHTHARTHARTHASTHARAHTRTHTHAHSLQSLKVAGYYVPVLRVSLNIGQNVGEDVLYGRIHCVIRHRCIQFHKIHHPSLLVHQLPRVTPWNDIFILIQEKDSARKRFSSMRRGSRRCRCTRTASVRVWIVATITLTGLTSIL